MTNALEEKKMANPNNLTTGNEAKTLIKFAMPYLLACFMQTFYGMVDLFVVGLYNTSSTTTAVSIGSQVTHMITVIIAGFAMGTTVKIGRAIGAGDDKEAKKAVGNTALFFCVFAIMMAVILFVLTNEITKIMLTPVEAFDETAAYLRICFIGVPFITMYNVISSIFRGAGDSKSPMYFVGVACVVNVALDFLLVGACGMGATGAAVATIIGQAMSSIIGLVVLLKKNLGFKILKKDIKINGDVIKAILSVGTPLAIQDGLIQVAFIVITVIANSRGLIAASGVGITEKIIGFMFLVPSAFLSAISAITAQNMGAGKPERARKTLKYGLIIVVCYGFFCALYNQFLPDTLIGIFTRDEAVVAAGALYLMSYSFDVMFAGIHFCFSGYFCGDRKSIISFIHNIASIILIRIPGAYLASIWYPESLYPMGWAAPLGSILSALICIVFYVVIRNREKRQVASGND